MGAICALFFVAACQGPIEQKPDLTLNNTNSATVIVYRTKQAFHSLNPEKPYVYLDGEHIGNLGTGESVSRRVAAGSHTISMKNPILFMPAKSAGSIDLIMEAGKTYYIRYSYNASGLAGTYTTGAPSLGLADEESFRALR